MTRKVVTLAPWGQLSFEQFVYTYDRLLQSAFVATYRRSSLQAWHADVGCYWWEICEPPRWWDAGGPGELTRRAGPVPTFATDSVVIMDLWQFELPSTGVKLLLCKGAHGDTVFGATHRPPQFAIMVGLSRDPVHARLYDRTVFAPAP